MSTNHVFQQNSFSEKRHVDILKDVPRGKHVSGIRSNKDIYRIVRHNLKYIIYRCYN